MEVSNQVPKNHSSHSILSPEVKPDRIPREKIRFEGIRPFTDKSVRLSGYKIGKGWLHTFSSRISNGTEVAILLNEPSTI